MDKQTLEKEYEEITDVTFDHEGAHLASTHVLQGGASNGKNTPLILKSEKLDVELTKALEQVTMTLSMEEYLRKFYDLWYDEAEVLAKLMGFETETEYKERMNEDSDDMESYSEYHTRMLEEKVGKVEILRSAKDTKFKDLTDEQQPVVKNCLSQLVKGIAQHEELFKASLEQGKGSSSTAKEGEDKVTEVCSDSEVTKTSGDNDSITKNSNQNASTSSKTNSDSITKEDNTQEVSNVSKDAKIKDTEVSELEKAQAKIADLEKAAAKSAELEKSLEKAMGRVDALEKAEDARIEKAYGAFADELSFIGEAEDKAELVKALMSVSDLDAGVVLFDALEKAQKSLSAGLVEEAGAEGEAEVTKSNDILSDLIKAKYAK